ncbi:MAG: MnmC family methyltransferase [Cyanobium sp.]
MTWNGCGPEAGEAMAGGQLVESRSQELVPRLSRDGSFSLYSPEFGEGFHCADGALSEARRVFVAPAELQRFAAGGTLRVLEVAVGTGTNTAALVQACQERGLRLDWWGLELDPLPLRLALGDDGFRRQWPGAVLGHLESLCGGERLLWGDGRVRLPQLLERLAGRCDLVLHDGFSPRHCPQLWSLEFLRDLAGLLAPRGRLLTYCSAAAVRRSLLLCELQLAAISSPDPARASAPLTSSATGLTTPASTDAKTDGRSEATEAWRAGSRQGVWSAGTVASPSALVPGPVLRRLSPMELEHLACRAGEPYRDPGRNGTAAAILERRLQQQRLSAAESSGQWQRRWGLARRHGPPPQHGSPPQLGPPPQLGSLPPQLGPLPPQAESDRTSAVRQAVGPGPVDAGSERPGPAERAR